MEKSELLEFKKSPVSSFPLFFLISGVFFSARAKALWDLVEKGRWKLPEIKLLSS